jgi:hypothetical protein
VADADGEVEVDVRARDDRAEAVGGDVPGALLQRDAAGRVVARDRRAGVLSGRITRRSLSVRDRQEHGGQKQERATFLNESVCEAATGSAGAEAHEVMTKVIMTAAPLDEVWVDTCSRQQQPAPESVGERWQWVRKTCTIHCEHQENVRSTP